MKQKLLKLIPNKDIENEFLRRFEEDYNFDSMEDEGFSLVLKDLSKIENSDSVLLHLIKKDRIKFFNSPKEGQDIVKGAFLRTLWLLKELRKARNIAVVAPNKYKNPRHA